MHARLLRTWVCALVSVLGCATTPAGGSATPDRDDRAAAPASSGVAGAAAGAPARAAGPATVAVTFRTGGGGVTVDLRVPGDDLSDREKALYASVRKGDERPEELLEAALRIEGITDKAELERLRKAARAAYEELLPTVRVETDAFQQARVLLAMMHERLLKTYVVDQTYVSVALDKHAFNCVSSAILYNVFAGWLGLQTGGALQPTHAFSWVRARDRRVEVETTDPQGFDPLPSPAEWKAFLNRLRVPVAEREKAQFVNNAVLVSRIAVNRIAFEHDGVAAEGTPAEEKVLRVSLALGRRILALAPEDHVSSRNQGIRLERIAVKLIDGGRRLDEGWALLRLVVKLAGLREDRDRAFQNLKWAAGRLGKLALEAGDEPRFEKIRAEAAETISCDARPLDCDELDAHLREVNWSGIIAHEKVAPEEDPWPSVEALLKRFPAGKNENAYYYVRRELDRRWDEKKPEPADEFLRAQIQRFTCAGELARGCAEIEGRAAFLWFRLDIERALAWARSAYKHDPNVPGVKSNYAALLNNALLRQVERRECGEVQRLAREMASVDALTAEAKDLTDRCRPRETL